MSSSVASDGGQSALGNTLAGSSSLGDNREMPVRRVGKYRILSELGRGGMANVFLAVARGPGGVSKLVVLKALLPDFATEPDALSMFLDEARLAAQLNHANVVQTYEVGTEGDRHIIVMEYLEGQSLSGLAKRAEASGRPLPLNLHLRIVINVLEGLHYAHELSAYDGSPLSFVHRDVSPQNIFVTYDGQVKVLDFGIAKANSSSTHTATGIVKGKISYMAPEQMVADAVDRRADIYSVGCMLWAIATGRKLWKDVPDVQIMRRVINGELPTPQSVNPGCDDELNRIVMKALATNVGERYQTALDLQADIEAYCERLGGAVRQKEIGNLVSSLFAETRSELKALIERRLAQVTTDDTFGDLSASEVRSTISGSRQFTPASLNGMQSGQQPIQPENKKSKYALLAGVAVLMLGIGYYLNSNRQETGTNAVPRTLTQVAPDSEKPAPAPAAAPTVATLQLRANRPEAKLFLDDEALPSNPTSKVLPIDGKVHRLRAEAEGYASSVAEFSVLRDDSVEVSLSEASSSSASNAAKRASARYAPRAAARPAEPAKPAVAAPTAEKKPVCDHPFFVDTDGIKKIRPECM